MICSREHRICDNICVYTVRLARDVVQDLRRLRAHDRQRVVDAIETKLPHEATLPTRNRKRLAGLVPPWTAEPPVWELRVGEFRVFYDVDDDVIYVRAVRRKPRGATTEEIL